MQRIIATKLGLENDGAGNTVPGGAVSHSRSRKYDISACAQLWELVIPVMSSFKFTSNIL